MLDLFVSQISDVFRIGLLVALVITTWRTSQATGLAVPLIAGMIFVAVIIPATRQGFNMMEVGVGLLANAVILLVILAVAAAVRSARRGN